MPILTHAYNTMSDRKYVVHNALTNKYYYLSPAGIRWPHVNETSASPDVTCEWYLKYVNGIQFVLYNSSDVNIAYMRVDERDRLPSAYPSSVETDATKMYIDQYGRLMCIDKLSCRHYCAKFTIVYIDDDADVDISELSISDDR